MRSCLISLFLMVIKTFNNLLIIRMMISLISLIHPYVSKISEKRTKVVLDVVSNGFVDMSITNTGCLLISGKEVVTKIPLCRENEDSLHREFLSYQKLVKTEASKLVSYSLNIKRHFGMVYYEVSKLTPLACINSQELINLLDNIELAGKSYDKTGFIMPEYLVAFEKINDELGEGFSNVLNDIKYIAKNTRLKISPMHGDLMLSNIMTFHGKLVLIDLDRFTKEGCRSFDLIHYYVELNARSQKNNSYSYIAQNHRVICNDLGVPLDTLLLYVVYRLGAENRDTYQLPKSYYYNVSLTLREINQSRDNIKL